MFRRDAFSFGFNAALGAAVLALLVFAGWGLTRAVGDVIGPFIVSAVVALTLDPLVTFIQARVTRGNRMRALVLVCFAFLGIFGALLAYVIPAASTQAQRMVRYFTPVTYTIRRADGQSGRYITVVQGMADDNAVVTGLVNGQEYDFVVYAVHADGQETPSRTVRVMPREEPLDEDADKKVASNATGPRVPAADAPDPTPPIGPGMLTAEPGDRFVRLTWRRPVAGKSGFDELRDQVDLWLAEHKQVGPVKMPTNLDSLTAQYSEQAAQYIKNFANRFAGVVVGSVSWLLTVVLVPIITIYVLADMDRLRARLFFLMPDRVRGQALDTAAQIGSVFGNYVRGLVIVCSLYALASLVTLLVISLWFPAMRGYALLLGLVAGLLYAVPYVGALATVLMTAVAVLASGSGLGALVVTTIVLSVLNQGFDNVIYPKVVGGEVGLHPLLAMFALILGGKMLGLWGMLLSVPAAASFQAVLFRLYPRLKAPTPISLLMKRERPVGPEEPPSRSPRPAAVAADKSAQAAGSAEVAAADAAVAASNAASAASNAADAAGAASEAASAASDATRESPGASARPGA